MKKAGYILAVLLMFVGGTAFAKEASGDKDSGYKYEIRVGYSGISIPELIISGRSHGHDPLPYINTLHGVYTNVNYDDIYTAGTISAEIDFRIKKWFSISVGAYVNTLFSARKDGYTGKTVSIGHEGSLFTLLPMARFTYLNKEYVRLYSAVGLGVTLVSLNTEILGFPTVQATPIGVAAGKRVFGFAELNLGVTSLGGRIGVGFKF